MSFKSNLRKGSGIVIGALVGISNFALKAWFAFIIPLGIALFFFNPPMALMLAFCAMGSYLGYRTVINYFQNQDSNPPRVIEHTPISQAIIAGCQATDIIAGPTQRVHRIIDRKANPEEPVSNNASFMQKVVDKCDGVFPSQSSSRRSNQSANSNGQQPSGAFPGRGYRLDGSR